jgi:hypothetical protein
MQPRAHAIVYFISDGEHVKIGWSRNVAKRLEILAGANPRPLELLGTKVTKRLMRGPYGGGNERWDEATWRMEERLHVHFQAQRVRGEWFRLDDRMRRFIRRFCDDGDPRCL